MKNVCWWMHRNIYFVKQSNFDPPWSKVPLTLNIPRRGRPLWFSSEVSAKIILNYFFLCQNRQKMGFSNLSVLKKGLLFQDWVFNPNWHEGGYFYLLVLSVSPEFLSKFSKLFWRWKLKSIGLIWHPSELIESYKKCP